MGNSSNKIVVTLLILTLCISITVADENNSDKYTLERYGGEEFTPQPMEFGENIKNQEKNGLQATSETGKNATERKHVYLQFYSTPNNDQLGLLESYGVYRVGIADDNTYIFSMSADITPADLPAESGLRWMGTIPVENKYDKSFGLNVPEWAKTENGEVKLAVFFYEDVDSQDALSILKQYSHNYSAPSNSRPWYYETIANETNITLIVSEDAVYSSAYYGFDTIPTEGSGFVDYGEIIEEDVDDPTSIDEQETNVTCTENGADTGVEKSPSFSSTITILLILTISKIMRQKQHEKR